MTQGSLARLFVCALAAGLQAQAADAPAAARPAETPAQFAERMAWWREARFGMFIHWGIMSIPGRECWVMYNERIPADEYEKLVPRYNPTNYSARDIVSLARAAGQKYIVFVAKHHDGFCMWNSRLSDYSIMATPFQRDIVKELAEECARQGLKLGLYYSILDWHHPFARWQHWPKYVDYMKGQLRELLTQYGPIAVLWFDGEWAEEWTDRQGADLYHHVRSLQPGIIINNRVGKGRRDMEGGTKAGFFAGDFETPEQQVPANGWPGVNWEACMTINNSWSFTTKDTTHKTSAELIHLLADIASKGGNLLLNIGPRPDGSILEEQRDRLLAMGRWLRANGESIYGTAASPFPRRLPWGRCTSKPGRLYLHVFDWPKDGRLVLPGLQNQVTRAYLLSDSQRASLPASRSDIGAVVQVPAGAPDACDSVVVAEIAGPPEVLPFRIAQASDGTVPLLARDAEIHGSGARYDSLPGRDSIGYWIDLKEWVSWDFTLREPGPFSVEVTYGCDEGSGGGEYVIEVAGWKLAARARATGGWFQRVTDPAGRVQLTNQGPHSLAVRLKSKPGLAVMDLQRVTLHPVRD